MVVLDAMDLLAPAGSKGDEDIGSVPQNGRHFHQKGKCYLLTYAMYARSEDTEGTTWYDTIKELVDHLYTLQQKGVPLLQYAMGVTQSHDLKEEEFLVREDPSGKGKKSKGNADFAFVMEATTEDDFLSCLKECQPCDLAKYHYKDTTGLPEGVCPPQGIKGANCQPS
ncbi:hypothetical protein OPQ81_011730 [Rhizoctonia solani]|nr:hypothetical protein OPQ81_011730 [Rhizoctonia solani]